MNACGAKTRSGGLCKRAPMPNGRCKLHGGANPAGPASHLWKTGKYSRYGHLLAADDQDDFFEALAAPDPLDLKDEGALIKHLIKREVFPGPDLYAVRRILRELETTLEAVLSDDVVPPPATGLPDGWDDADVKSSEEATGDLIEKALALVQEAQELLTNQEARKTDVKTVQGLVNTLKGLVDTSGRILDIRANSFTRIQSVAFVSRIVELIGGNVRDPADRKRLLTALTQFAAEIAPAHQAIGAKG